jgi:predicted transcriptional regulator of viral defense system
MTTRVSRKHIPAAGLFSPRNMSVRKNIQAKLQKLLKDEAIEHIGHGVYRNLNLPMTRYHSFLEPALRSPQGVICLLSALSFHRLTTQQPSEIWFAIANKAHPPKVIEAHLRIIHMSENSLHEGVETHIIEGLPIHIFGIAKTIADCFKFRSKVGLDVAIEALKECREQQRCSIQELWHFAQICRVSSVMLPYLELLA